MDGSLPFTKLDIAVVGAGIAGLSASWLLSKHHKVTLYEKEYVPGGHSRTIQVPEGDQSIAIDTGFIVYNEQNYPQFTELLRYLKVKTQPTSMSFSYSLSDRQIEYCGNGLNGLFGQRKNLLNFHFWRLLRDVIRFYKEAERSGLLMPPDMTVRQFLGTERYSQAFIDMHLIPMISAIWSTSGKTALDTPISTVVKFFSNHGLLQLKNRPTWRTVSGGSHVYVWRLLNGTRIDLRLGSHIRSIIRPSRGVIITNSHGETRKHDALVLATHADQALSLLSNPTDQEQQLLGKFLYEKNKVVLHTDQKQMPLERRIWSSWNVKGASTNSDPITVTYWMNKLQGLSCDTNYFVSLNPSSIGSSAQLHTEFCFSHPILNSQMALAQHKLYSIQGKNNTWFCGSYFGYGFHEDALVSGLEVAEALGAQRPWLPSTDRSLNTRIHIPQNSPVL